MTEVCTLLIRLGVTINYTGFFYTACAVSLCVEEPERLLRMTGYLYPEVARRFGTNWKAVERNIRTVGTVIWRENRELLERLARRPLKRKPCTAQLLAILAASLAYPLPEEDAPEKEEAQAL